MAVIVVSSHDVVKISAKVKVINEMLGEKKIFLFIETQKR
jgi:hypothetical protein